MSPRLSTRSLRMPASPIRKLLPLALAAAARGVRIHHLNIGQPDIETPAAFREALAAVRDPVVGYGPSQGLPEYLDAVSAYFRRRGFDLSPDEILATTGGSEALLFALQAVCDPGDEVVVVEPFYTNYNGFSCALDVNLRPVPADPSDGYRLPSTEALAAAIGPRTRAILLCSPNNPTGTILTRSELERVADLAEEHDLWVLSDEVYREFAYEGEAVSVMHVPRLRDRAVLLDSVSKRYSACGARVGCLASRDRDLLSVVLRLGQARLCPPTLEQVAAVAAYRLPDSYFEGVRKEYRARRDVVVEGLRRIPGVTCSPPAGAFYVMAGLPVADADRFCAWLLSDFSHEGETVMLAPGAGFYATPGRGRSEVRIAYVLEARRCARAMDLLRIALERYRNEVEGRGTGDAESPPSEAPLPGE